jgi:glyoxylase-like metal-dependent hydrolase (beta-lactamase superfamily II)
MTLLRKRSQLDNKASLFSILIYLLCTLGCNPRETAASKVESYKIDSLIILQYVNDRTVLVKFGYDALTAIKTSNGIVVVDAGISTSLTNRYKKLVESELNQKNFIYVINTHGHHDHIRGNSIFLDAQIIGHESCKNDATEIENTDSTLIRIGRIVNEYDQQLRQLSPDTHEWEDNFTQKIRYSGACLDISKNIPLSLPNITFHDSLNLKCGDITFEIKYFGKFHSNSDILIYVPEIKTLFIGDLFSKYGRPSMSDSSLSDVDRWIQALQWIRIRTNNIGTIIDGHGQILSIYDLKQFSDNLLSKYSYNKNK